jgi:hypothetical protein
MRQVARHPLPAREAAYLARKQGEINSGRPVQPTWEAARRTRTMGQVAQVLAVMAGRR